MEMYTILWWSVVIISIIAQKTFNLWYQPDVMISQARSVLAWILIFMTNNYMAAVCVVKRRVIVLTDIWPGVLSPGGYRGVSHHWQTRASHENSSSVSPHCCNTFTGPSTEHTTSPGWRAELTSTRSLARPPAPARRVTISISASQHWHAGRNAV